MVVIDHSASCSVIGGISLLMDQNAGRDKHWKTALPFFAGITILAVLHASGLYSYLLLHSPVKNAP